MPERICKDPECERPVGRRGARGLCRKHYQRWQRLGTTALPTAADRFWPRVDRHGPNDCWPWLGAKAHGYGRFWDGKKVIPAHQFAFELLIGPVPAGKELDHVRERGCVRTDCCNPAHLEPVVHRENILRGDAPTALHARKTHCPAGHPYSGPNLRIDTDGGRRCRACESRHNRNRKK